MMLKMKYGCTRTVFVLKNVAIKVPTLKKYNLFLRGILANLQEKQFSKMHNDLAKVKWCSPMGIILIMDRAEILADTTENSLWPDFYEMLQEKYKDDQLRDFLLSDCKPSNWGYIKGCLVKIDYGN